MSPVRVALAALLLLYLPAARAQFGPGPGPGGAIDFGGGGGWGLDFGFEAGQLRLDTGDQTLTMDTYGGFTMGVPLNDFFSLDLTIGALGDQQDMPGDDGDRYRIRINDDERLTLRARMPIIEDAVFVYGRVGVGYLDYETVNLDNHAHVDDGSTNAVVGAGLQWALGRGLSLQAEWTALDAIDLDASAWTIGMHWGFGR